MANKEKMDHSDPSINHMIQLLKKNAEQRLKSDLTEISGYLKDVKFFHDQGIEGNDLLEICEMLGYQKIK